MRKLIKTLTKSFNILKESQEEIRVELKNYKFYDKITIKDSNRNFVISFKSNFFTILMLSLLLESGVERKRCVSYGKIILLLRQIVTSCDNILDNERKGILFIESLKNLVVENSLITLVSQELLTKEIFRIEKEINSSSLQSKLLEKLYCIAEGESLRRVELYREYPDSNYILNKVHREIGGELLEISLTIPKIVENNLKLNKFSQGLFIIGMSLQALDDFFDMAEDFEDGNINLATSKYREEFRIEPQNIDFKKLDVKFVEKYIKDTIDEAYHGFDILEKSGFPIDRNMSKFILKKLFILRGLKDYIHYIE
jgi:hypothetical protein